MNRMSKTLRLAAALAALGAGLPAAVLAGEEEVTLKDAPGREQVMNNCTLCHSVDYIRMNSPFMNKTAWQATTNKMIKVMGAPVSPADLPVIIDYLTRNYGAK